MTPGRGERPTPALPGGVTSSPSLAARKSVKLPRKPSRWVQPPPLRGAPGISFPSLWQHEGPAPGPAGLGATGSTAGGLGVPLCEVGVFRPAQACKDPSFLQ